MLTFVKMLQNEQTALQHRDLLFLIALKCLEKKQVWYSLLMSEVFYSAKDSTGIAIRQYRLLEPRGIFQLILKSSTGNTGDDEGII